MNFAFSAMIQISLLSTGANGYAEAHKVHSDTGQPMVLLVGAEWCPGCVQMKDNILPRVARRGLLRKVAFAHVNTDRESRIAKSVMQGGSIPQLIMYRKTPNGWKRHLLVGLQSPEKVEAFINKGLELDNAERVQVSKVSYESPQSEKSDRSKH
jgi:thioredoxin-like negative regulator of GroEL